MPLFVEGFGEALSIAGEVLLQWWWIPLPFILAAVAWNVWLSYIRARFVSEIEWITLQLIVPQEVTKTPLAMEQVFAGLHGVMVKGNRWARYVKGRVQEWFSFEIVSDGGDIRFYIRTPKKFRNLVESHIYAQYPETEIYEVDDYVWDVPENLPNSEYDVFGSEFVLDKDPAYPIRTYESFTFETEEGEGDIDPLSSFIEALSRIREGEKIWFQYAIKPIGSDWKKGGDTIVEDIIAGKEDSSSSGSGTSALEILGQEIFNFFHGLIQALFSEPTFGSVSEDKKDDKKPGVQDLSPGKRDILEAIERNIAKVGFETAIRGVYIARRDLFSPPIFFSVVNAYRQFSVQGMNAIKPNGETLTAATWPFKKYKETFLKRNILFKYRYRYKPAKPAIFSIESLATLYHFPGSIITTPTIPRIETKKGKPPPTLPSS